MAKFATAGKALKQLTRANNDLTTDQLNKLATVTASATELNKLAGSGAVVANGTTQSSIADISDSASGAQLETAVNGIIAALVEFGIVEEAGD